MSKKVVKLEVYKKILNDIRYLLDKAKSQAYKAVDNIRVQTYWQVGERIAREELKFKSRAEYGKNIVERLAKDINFSPALIWRLLQFYKTYPILVTVSRELSWSHYRSESKRLTEKKFESKIIKYLKRFMLKLGKGFLFFDKQYRLTMDNEHHYVDLVYYNVYIKCYVGMKISG